MSSNVDATIEVSGNDPGPSTPAARVLPEHALNSEGNTHDESDTAYSSFSVTNPPVNGGTNSDATSSSVPAINSNGALPRPEAKAPNKTPGKRVRADSNANSAGSNAAAAVPTKKRVRSNALMRSAPRATSTTTPGGLAGNTEFMYAHCFSFPRFENSES